MTDIAARHADLSSGRLTYPVVVRITHWSTALAVVLLIGSGWRIYDQEMAGWFAYFIPLWATLGGEPSRSEAINGETGFANALMWHFAAACLLIASFLAYLLYGLVSRRFQRHWRPITPKAVVRDVIAAVSNRLQHRVGYYNAVQRFAYVLVAFGILFMLASGLAIWKPVQLWWLTMAFGGFHNAMLAHFLGMSGIVLFLAVHVLMALTVPRSIQAMITGHVSPASEGFMR